jgi:hypothetical protein
MTRGLIRLDFQFISIDPYIFVNGKGLIIGTWIDDLAITDYNLSDIKKFKTEFDKIFKIKNLKKLKKILNIKIRWNRPE